MKDYPLTVAAYTRGRGKFACSLHGLSLIHIFARIVGWSAHRIEELVCMNKIIRPAYMSVMRERG